MAANPNPNPFPFQGAPPRVSNQTGAANPSPDHGVNEVYDQMQGYLRSTHWSKPYYSALIHNNPQLPYRLLQNVNCSYLSTHGRPPTLLALKQHAQSLAVLISLLAPAQYGGALEPPDDGKTNGDRPFATEQAFDWLNDMATPYDMEDDAHSKPLNALVNLVRSNSDAEGTRWHCPLETSDIELPENQRFQQRRPYETHLTLLMHANEILERLDHEYSAMGGILSIIPLDSENVDEQDALEKAKTTLVGQWILYTQHLAVRMHELEIAYGNSLDLLANEAIVPMQHISIHGPDGRSGREIVYPQDRWILANAGEDVFTFIHQMLDRAEAHQDAQDDVFSDQQVLGDAAFSTNDESKYRGIVKTDLNTRYYRIRGSGHGPIFVLPAFGDRPNTEHTRDMENRPTVLTIPQPSIKDPISQWESQHKDLDAQLLQMTVERDNLQAQVDMLEAAASTRDTEIRRLNDIKQQYDNRISDSDRSLLDQIVHLREVADKLRDQLRDCDEEKRELRQDIDNFKQANISVNNNPNPLNPLVNKINDQQRQIRDLQRDRDSKDRTIQNLRRTNDTRNLFNNIRANDPTQIVDLRDQIDRCNQERQALHQELSRLRSSRAVQGTIFNFPAGVTLDYGSTFTDDNLGITACNTTFFQGLLAAQRAHENCDTDRNNLRAEHRRIERENANLRSGSTQGIPAKFINLPAPLEYTSHFRDDNQGLIVINTTFFDYLIATERAASSRPANANTTGIINLPQPLDYASTWRDDNQGMIVLNTAWYDHLVAVEASSSRPAGIINLPAPLDYASTWRDDNQGLIVMNTTWYDHLIAAERSEGIKTARIQDLQRQLDDSRRPINLDTNGFFNIPGSLDYTSTWRDDNRGLIVLNTTWYDHLVAIERADANNATQIQDLQDQLRRAQASVNLNTAGLFDLPHGLDYTSTLRDDNRGLIMLNTAWYDYLVSVDANNTAQITALQDQIRNARPAANADLGNLITRIQQTLTTSSVFTDTQRNIAVLRLAYYNQLQGADSARNALQQQLDGAQGQLAALQLQLDAQNAQNNATNTNNNATPAAPTGPAAPGATPGAPTTPGAAPAAASGAAPAAPTGPAASGAAPAAAPTTPGAVPAAPAAGPGTAPTGPAPTGPAPTGPAPTGPAPSGPAPPPNPNNNPNLPNPPTAGPTASFAQVVGGARPRAGRVTRSKTRESEELKRTKQQLSIFQDELAQTTDAMNDFQIRYQDLEKQLTDAKKLEGRLKSQLNAARGGKNQSPS
ncbi:hypothetical protein F4777DRAFT_516010 [Nemania sp. FL0916]|nr:hypothetical protein F4777DRAFT_516010 [Nemania sp. FL0916]